MFPRPGYGILTRYRPKKFYPKDVEQMDTLEQARAEIDAVDAQLAALFERRMAAVLSVAQYKQAHGLPVYDAAREAVVLEKAAARIHTNPSGA